MRWQLPQPPATPGASKTATQVKTAVVAKEGTATSGEQDSAGTTTAATTPTPGTIVPAVTPQAEVAGKPKAENGIVDAAKADIAGTSAPASPSHAAGNGHAATADASQTLANSADNSLQAAGAIQTQQPATSSTAQAAAPQLNVTAATRRPRYR